MLIPLVRSFVSLTLGYVCLLNSVTFSCFIACLIISYCFLDIVYKRTVETEVHFFCCCFIIQRVYVPSSVFWLGWGTGSSSLSYRGVEQELDHSFNYIIIISYSPVINHTPNFLHRLSDLVSIWAGRRLGCSFIFESKSAGSGRERARGRVWELVQAKMADRVSAGFWIFKIQKNR